MAINPLIALGTKTPDYGSFGESILAAVTEKKEQKRQDLKQKKADERADRQENREDRRINLDEQKFESQEGRENRRLSMEEAEFSSAQELKKFQRANAKIEAMDAREKRRMESVILGGADLNAFLESGDIKGAENYLTQRRVSLGQRIAAGEDVDTRETDEALAALRSGDPAKIEELKTQTQSLKKIGVLRGVIDSKSADGGFTLSPGQNRYDTSGNLIASGPPKNPGSTQSIDENGNVTYVDPKPLTAAALKLQNEALDQIATASNIDADLGTIISQIDDKKLDLGLFKNLESAGRNAVGKSTEESRNFDTFRATLEKMRNDSLRLNKGVQTEGDAVRAWNELSKNITDEKLVKERLGEIQNINRRAAELKQLEVDQIRANFGQPSIDYSKFQKGSALGDDDGWTVEEVE